MKEIKNTNINAEDLRQEAREHIMEVLDGYEGYTCDFHNEAFNMEYYVEDEDEAIEKLAAIGTYQAIGYVTKYERDEFGENIVDVSDPCAVLNLLWYIIGEEELYSMFEDCDLWDEWWNDEITEEQSAELIAWAKENDKI